MSLRTLLVLVTLVVATAACSSDWPPDAEAAIAAAETTETNERVRRPSDGAERAAAVMTSPTTTDVVEPAGDPLPRRGEWTDLGASPSTFTGGLVVVVDRISTTPDTVTIEARLVSQRDRDSELLYDPSTVLRLITENGFMISATTQSTSWESPAERERTFWPLPSGGSETIVATFDRPLVDPPVGLAIRGFEDLPLQLG